MRRYNPIIPAPQDSYPVNDVGGWSKEKYTITANCLEMFTKAMKSKWHLVYVDLFSGSGFSKVKGQEYSIYNTAMIAMDLPVKFDKYIICDFNESYIEAFKYRQHKLQPELDVSYYIGDSNTNINNIVNELKKIDYIDNGVLKFCFVDPYKISNLKFDTIKKIAEYGKTDLLILHALYMDANRNYINYSKDDNENIANYLGDPSWKTEFEEKGFSSKDFSRYIGIKYQEQLEKYNYISEMKLETIKNSKNSPIYCLGFYSKNKLGLKFFDEATKYGRTQQGMF